MAQSLGPGTLAAAGRWNGTAAKISGGAPHSGETTGTAGEGELGGPETRHGGGSQSLEFSPPFAWHCPGSKGKPWKQVLRDWTAIARPH